MILESMSFALEVSGDMACFTRPEFKVERVSYDVITPSAARSIFEAIYWKPQMKWVVEKIEVLNPISLIQINRTMGRKYIVPYALYVGQGYVSANLAAQSGFSEEDLELLWAGLENMFEDDRSAARGRMSVRKLIIFRHQSKLGNAQSDLLFDAIKITRHDPETPARSFSDYKVTIDKSAIPKGVELIERV